MEEVKQQIEKSMQWYFHPNEIVRLLRYFQLNMKFDNQDYTPHYNTNDLKLGVVIEANSKIPYIDLQLYFLKEVNKIENILIYDDCSSDQKKLKDLAEKYKVDFYSSEQKMFNKEGIGSIADTDSVYQGLIWAKAKELDLLVKVDSRLLACYNWKDDFINLALSSEANTFSSYCEQDIRHFRTECMGFNVNSWNNQYPLQSMKFTILNELPVFTEFWFHELAKTLAGNNYSEKWDKYQKEKKYGYLHSGYAMWQDLLGTNKYTNDNRHSNVLWFQYSKPEDYYEVSKTVLKDKYSLADFNLT